MGQVLPAERWLELRPLLDQALDLEPPERVNLLADLGLRSPALRADLERLLRHHASADGELDRPAAQLVGATLLIEGDGVQAPDAAEGAYRGTRIGAFQLETLIGSGGMGAVYRARRISGGFEQTVAIKLITGLHPGLKKRFTQERQILADLRHPHIAQLLDGGETVIGLPYLVMEFIDGDNLVDYCERTQATLDERLRLLIDVAEALQHAHQRKLIHRDIKPGNIMVSGDGEVKLLDFGIAKLLDDADRSALTQQGLGPMTPAYAAPEQFSGAALGAATDIYQWGVLAFRLLSGRSPYRHDSGNPLLLARLVSDSAPLSLQSVLKPPSGRVLAAQTRSLQSAGDSDSVPEPELARLPSPPPDLTAHGRTCADLDLILRRCLKKRPEQRYPDMRALIGDLQSVRQRHAPSVRHGLRRQRWLVAVALIGVLIAAVALLRWLPWSAGNPWADDAALNAMGLQRSHLHLGHASTETLIVQALRREAQGDAASARALLETAAGNDSDTPVPAMLLAYWAQTPADASRWHDEAQRRLQSAHDATLDLLWRFIQADLRGDVDEVLRYSGALLELNPGAWYLHMARAHRLNQRGLREAGLKELQQIDPSGLGHRKLSDAIADRASFGDLAGAQALAARLQVSPDDPDYAQLQARLAFSGGDLRSALAHFRDTVQRARQQARFDLEGRGLLYLGVMQGSLGDYPAAAESVRAARSVFKDRSQRMLTVDASLVLAQLAALAGNAEDVTAELEQARSALRGDLPTDVVDELVELLAARLQGRPPTVPEGADPGVAALIEGRRALLAGDSRAARAAVERARRERIEQSPLAEEYRLLLRDLGMEVGELPPLDPPFQPYVRFAARWAMGEGASVAGRPAAATP